MAQTRDIPTVRLDDRAVMPVVGFGTWRLSGKEAYEAVRTALDVGYRHIDTATMYGNEAEIGRAVRDSGLDRGEVFITTKLPQGNAGKERETIERSLRELGTDYVDLWLVHWPPAPGALVRTWRELLAVRDQGLARTVGVSNHSIAQIDELIRETGEAPAVNQIPWSPPRHSAGLLTQHRDRGIVVEGYSPIKGTKLHDPAIVEIAERHGVTPAQVVLRWHLLHDIVVIPKSADPGRIAENFDLFGFALDEDEMARLDAMAG
jgi:2,5-diketo-D-gluconate reductase A